VWRPLGRVPGVAPNLTRSTPSWGVNEGESPDRASRRGLTQTEGAPAPLSSGPPGCYSGCYRCISWGDSEGVTGVLPRCYRGVSRGVTGVLPMCYQGVTRGLLGAAYRSRRRDERGGHRWRWCGRRKHPERPAPARGRHWHWPPPWPTADGRFVAVFRR